MTDYMGKSFRALIAIITLFLLHASISNADTLRVLLLNGVPTVDVSCSASLNAIDPSGRVVALKPDRTTRWSVRNGRISADDVGAFASPLRLEAPFVISVNGRPYRGSFVLHAKAGKLIVVNEIDLEDYLYGVVPGEVPKSWSDEVIKAQSVVARTFAQSRRTADSRSIWDLDDSTLSQMYGGYAKEDDRVSRLVDRTAGEVLFYGGKPAVAYYHSTCGGRTEDSGNVWSSSLFYLRPVPCSWCKDSPYLTWSLALPVTKLAARLGTKANDFDIRSLQVRIIGRNESGRVSRIEVSDSDHAIVMKGNEFRNLVGTTELKSLNFATIRRGNDIVFQGRGWGHGVGMCQWGAKSMSDAGTDYRRILQYYYRGVKLVKQGSRER
jgi:stage II sporulation protein D